MKKGNQRSLSFLLLKKKKILLKKDFSIKSAKENNFSRKFQKFTSKSIKLYRFLGLLPYTHIHRIKWK